VFTIELEAAMSEQESATEQLINARRLVYFAAERTLMAWVRTALGMMALGFVIDRFGLVLRQNTPATIGVHLPRAYSFWGGSMLVLVGALMALVATIRYWRFAHDFYHDNSTRPGHGIMIGVVFTALLAMLGFAVTVFLINAGA
jgi:putative membrane protein